MMRSLWLAIGVGGFSTVAAASDLSLNFDIAIDNVDGNNVVNVVDVVAGNGGAVAATVQYPVGDDASASIVYRRSLAVSAVTVSTLNDTVYSLNNDTPTRTFADFGNLSLGRDQSGTDRVTFIAVHDDGSTHGIYQFSYNTSATQSRDRVLADGDTVGGIPNFSFDDGVDTNRQVQVNAAGHVLTNSSGSDNHQYVVRNDNSGNNAVASDISNGQTLSGPNPKKFNDLFEGGYSTQAINDSNNALFLANRNGIRSIVESTGTVGQTNVVLAEGSIGGHYVFPEELFGASNTGQLFRASIDDPARSGLGNPSSDTRWGVYYHDNGSQQTTLINEYTQPNDNQDYTGGTVTAGGISAIISRESSVKGIRYFDPSNANNFLVAQEGEDIIDGNAVPRFSIAQITIDAGDTVANSMPAVNENGWVIFDAILHDSQNDEDIDAILGWNPALNSGPVIIAREGGPISIGGQTFTLLDHNTSIDGSGGLFASMNATFGFDSGFLKDSLSGDNHLAFGVTYDNNGTAKSAVIVSLLSESETPEPASLSIAALAISGLLARRRSR